MPQGCRDWALAAMPNIPPFLPPFIVEETVAYGINASGDGDDGEMHRSRELT
jgi:hypothetical protein